MIIKPDSERKLVLLAPMAGITDKPYRQICRELGADACVSEMLSSDVGLYKTQKSRFRRNLEGEESPRIVQIAGADPVMMAEAARLNVDNGADIIDINMGCPAKKVCNAMAGSWLLKDEMLVARILEQVVGAVNIPVSLKIRTGWDRNSRNALNIARIAEASGIQRLTVHGRTRACRFTGNAEHLTTAAVKAEVGIQVIANGDINTVEEAERVLKITGADGIMIGRAAIGNPWLFPAIRQYLDNEGKYGMISLADKLAMVTRHLQGLYVHYGEYIGVRIARKHINRYCNSLQGFSSVRQLINKEENSERQLALVSSIFKMNETISLAA